MRWVMSALCWLAPLAAAAGEAQVVDATLTPSRDGTWRIDVTVEHADEGWDHYADAWDVMAPDGTVLATRALLHPHESEQPFTRSLSGLVIPDDVAAVTVRAHDSVHGHGPELTIAVHGHGGRADRRGPEPNFSGARLDRTATPSGGRVMLTRMLMTTVAALALAAPVAAQDQTKPAPTQQLEQAQQSQPTGPAGAADQPATAAQDQPAGAAPDAAGQAPAMTAGGEATTPKPASEEPAEAEPKTRRRR